MTWPSSASRCSRRRFPDMSPAAVIETVEALPAPEEHDDDVGLVPATSGSRSCATPGTPGPPATPFPSR